MMFSLSITPSVLPIIIYYVFMVMDMVVVLFGDNDDYHDENRYAYQVVVFHEEIIKNTYKIMYFETGKIYQ